jgi:hypothetical protein
MRHACYGDISSTGSNIGHDRQLLSTCKSIASSPLGRDKDSKAFVSAALVKVSHHLAAASPIGTARASPNDPCTSPCIPVVHAFDRPACLLLLAGVRYRMARIHVSCRFARRNVGQAMGGHVGEPQA